MKTRRRRHHRKPPECRCRSGARRLRGGRCPVRVGRSVRAAARRAWRRCSRRPPPRHLVSAADGTQRRPNPRGFLLGSRSACALPADDPVASARRCWSQLAWSMPRQPPQGPPRGRESRGPPAGGREQPLRSSRSQGMRARPWGRVGGRPRQHDEPAPRRASARQSEPAPRLQRRRRRLPRRGQVRCRVCSAACRPRGVDRRSRCAETPSVMRRIAPSSLPSRAASVHERGCRGARSVRPGCGQPPARPPRGGARPCAGPPRPTQLRPHLSLRDGGQAPAPPNRRGAEAIRRRARRPIRSLRRQPIDHGNPRRRQPSGGPSGGTCDRGDRT